MYGQVIFHRRPDPSLKAAEVSFRLASGAKWRLAERRVAMVRLLVQVRHQQWVRAESAKAYRPPTLLDGKERARANAPILASLVALSIVAPIIVAWSHQVPIWLVRRDVSRRQKPTSALDHRAHPAALQFRQ